MGLVDAVVDDPDLHPVARGGQVRPPERGRADERRRLVERRAATAKRVVAHGGLDPGDAGELRKPGNWSWAARPRARPGRCCSASARSRPGVRSRCGPAGSVAPRRGCGDSRCSWACAGRAGGRAALVSARLFGGRLRQWRRVERDHDLGSRRLRGGRPGKRKRRQPAEKNKTPFQEGNGTGARLESRADVAELVDAHGSGPCGRKPVEVQVLSSASPDPATFGPATAQTIRT